MRPVSALWNAAMTAGTREIVCDVQGYFNGEVTFTIPVIDGQIIYDVTARGRRRIMLTVPLYGPDGFRWDPGSDPFHPLATYGQRLRVFLGVRHLNGTTELMNQGFFLVSGTTTDETEGTVQVTGSDLIELLSESKILLQPDSVIPLPTDTHLTALQKMLYPALHSPTLDDRIILNASFATMPVFNLGGTTTIRDGDDRIEIMKKIADAWPARFWVNDVGVVRFEPPLAGPKPVPDVTVTAGTVTSTLIGRGRQQNRRRAYNSVRVTSLDSATGDVAGTALAFIDSGVLDVRGEYGWITTWYVSPYALTNDHAQDVADAQLRTGVLYTATERITCAPNPAIELNDTCRVITASGTFTGLVAAISMPLTAGGGPMTLDVTTETEPI